MRSLNKKITWLIISGLFIVALLGAMLGFWLYSQLWLNIQLKAQSGQVQLLSLFKADVAVASAFKVQVNDNITASVPVNQTIHIPLKGNYLGHVKLDTPIPLDLKVRYRGIIPINTFTDIESTTAILLPHLPELPLKVRVPLQFDIPVDLIIPVKTTARIKYQGPVTLGFNQTIQAPLVTRLHTVVPIHQQLNIPLVDHFNLLLYPSQKPLAIQFDTTIQQPLRQLKLVGTKRVQRAAELE